MWTLRKTYRFEAAHRLPHHDGKCARLHGHSWVMQVEVVGTELQISGPKSGMLVDFGDIGVVVKPIVEDLLDHHYLNESLAMENPTSEEVSRYVFGLLAPHFKGSAQLASVTISETCTSACRFEG
jgi:6-pyruvoyltetrahydropterin/6-carboxytetrahydropterin synthase